MTSAIFLSGVGILGIVCMWLSFMFAMFVVGAELANSDYRDYGAEWPCHLNTIESERVYNWTFVALFMWLVAQGSALLKYRKGTREYFEARVGAGRGLNLVLVGAGQVYLGALFLLATHFEWGLTCNNYNDRLHGSNFLWAAAALWIVGVAAMHCMPGQGVTAVGDPAKGAIFRAEHLVTGAGAEKMTLLTGFKRSG
jgi:hypothetical protein